MDALSVKAERRDPDDLTTFPTLVSYPFVELVDLGKDEPFTTEH